MDSLKIDMSTTSDKNSVLSESIASFNESSLNFRNSAFNCDVSELESLFSFYKSEIDYEINDLCNDLSQYMENLNSVVSSYEKVESDGVNLSDDEIVIPCEFMALTSWYSTDVNNSILYNSSVSSALVGFLKNVVISDGDPQAVDEFGNYVVATSDDGNLWIYDKTTGETIVRSLSKNCHSGGIAYKDGVLYVATGSSIYEYNFEGLVDGSNVNPISSIKSSITKNNKTTIVSFLTIGTSGELITGQFHFKDNPNFAANGGDASDLLVYELNNDNGESKVSNVITVSGDMTKIQGVCVYNKDGTDYYLLTSSYGKSNNAKSSLYVAVLNDSGSALEKVGEYSLPSGAEQISTTSDGNVMIIYEGDLSKNEISILDPDVLIDGVS